MKMKRYIQTGWLMTLLIGWGYLLASCADHADEDTGRQDEQQGQLLRLSGLTRAGGVEESSIEWITTDLSGMSVQLFMKEITPNKDEKKNLVGQVGYSGNNGGDIISTSTLYVKSGDKYKVFGYMPAGITTVEPTDISCLDFSYENYTTMTIDNMSTVSDQDVCVIIGVKGGPLANGEKVEAGIYDYTADYIPNYGFGFSILVDHLFAASELQFSIDETYSKLRKIKLKEVILKNTVTKVVKAVVQLNMGNNSTPVKSVDFSTLTSGATEVSLFRSTEGEELKTNTPLKISCNFAPGYTDGLVVESVYDVYDTAGKPIREGCHAENKLSNTTLSGLTRGQKKILKMTVNPTYLYVLSDPDADIPMVVAEETGD